MNKVGDEMSSIYIHCNYIDSVFMVLGTCLMYRVFRSDVLLALL